MARRVFFSFHYERDVWRVNQVRNSWVTKTDIEERGFIDAAAFEAVQKNGDAAVKKWIDDQLVGTSVTVVLIGTETSQRPYVLYEIKQSELKNNGLLGIYIHNLKDKDSRTDMRGTNPLTSNYSTYDWVLDNGYLNIGKWIEQAAQKAGR